LKVVGKLKGLSGFLNTDWGWTKPLMLIPRAPWREIKGWMGRRVKKNLRIAPEVVD